MRSRTVVWAAAPALTFAALAGCGNNNDRGNAPTLPPIVTTAPQTTTIVVATTLPRYYEIERGDTLTGIAAAYSIPVQALMEANPELSSPDDIRFGQFLVIPPREGLVAEQLPPTAPGQTAPTMPAAAAAPSTSAP